MESEPLYYVFLSAFLGAVVLGVVASKTNFCTMGAVSDWVNVGKKGRLWAWFVAVAVALLGVTLMEGLGIVSVSDTIPPYRTANFAWLRYMVGGILFGIGMTLAGGCGNKTLLNIGGGNMKSLLVFVIAGFMAYLMTKTDFYALLFHGWVSATTIDLASLGVASQSLPDMLSAVLGVNDSAILHYVLATALALCLFVLAFRDRSFRGNINNVIAGITVGLVVVGGWYASGGPLGQAAIEAVEWLDEKPLGVGVQSYTFINPLGETLYYLAAPADLLRITFGVMAVAGVMLGSLAYALVSGSFRLVWFTSAADFVKHVVGAVLMGVGGVLAMGCTIGQGISGASTLALGSFLALGSIILGSAVTMKIQYYQMMYEEEAGLLPALLSSLVDLHLLPGTLRRLDPP